MQLQKRKIASCIVSTLLPKLMCGTWCLQL